jgi:hypothetical protein
LVFQILHPAFRRSGYTMHFAICERNTPLTPCERNTPLSFHANAVPAARAAEAAGRHGQFWEMYDLLLEQQAEWKNAADAQPYFDSFAQSLGLNLTQLHSDIADPPSTRRSPAIRHGARTSARKAHRRCGSTASALPTHRRTRNSKPKSTPRSPRPKPAVAARVRADLMRGTP